MPGPDQNDFEYLKGQHEPQSLGLCWSCQVTVNTHNCIWVDETTPVCVCRGCWDQIPIGQRLLIAQKLKSAPKFEEAAELLQQVLKRGLGDGLPWDPDWLSRN